MVRSMEQTPFMKQLVANDKSSRDQALESLRTYLSSKREFSPIEILKLWKGLFYCMWMSDRPLAQQALASSLAQLIFILPLENVIPFLRGFWQTMQREWTNIDVLRMEKFLLLTRRYLAASFEVLKRYEWKEELVQEMLFLLSEIPCNAGELRVPNGMRYHIIDIYVDELEQLGYLEHESEAPINKLLEPLQNLTKSPTKTVRSKAKETLEDKRLPKEKKEDESVDAEDWEGFAD